MPDDGTVVARDIHPGEHGRRPAWADQGAGRKHSVATHVRNVSSPNASTSGVTWLAWPMSAATLRSRRSSGRPVAYLTSPIRGLRLLRVP